MTSWSDPALLTSMLQKCCDEGFSAGGSFSHLSMRSFAMSYLIGFFPCHFADRLPLVIGSSHDALTLLL